MAIASALSVYIDREATSRPLGVKDQTTCGKPSRAVCTKVCARKCEGRKLLIMQLVERVRLLPSLFAQAGCWKC